MLKIQFVYLHEKCKMKFLQFITCNKCKRLKDICPHIHQYIQTKYNIQVSLYPDIIIAFYEGGPHPDQDRKLLDLLKRNVPIIVCERLDSASSHLLSTHDKAHRPNPIHPHLNDLLGIFKNYTLKPRSLHNEPTILSRYHYKLLQDIYPEYADDHAITPTNTLSEDVLNRIKTVPWDIGSSCLSPKYIGLTPDIKTLDVFCSVSLKFGSYYSVHRQACIDAINTLAPSLKKETKQLPYNQYISQLRKAKICISPYGLGEFSYRDYEAICCGAILIKPDMSYVETYPDIYQANKTYVSCKIDFSDLKEVVERVLNNYQDYEHIKTEALNIIKTKQLYDFIDVFCENVIQLYDKQE